MADNSQPHAAEINISTGSVVEDFDIIEYVGSGEVSHPGAHIRSAPENIGGRLRQLRGDRTLQNFASELGVTKADYIDYESGKREIPASLLIALIKRGSIDPTWVLTGKRIGTVSGSARAAGRAYAAILEAALRAGVT